MVTQIIPSDNTGSNSGSSISIYGDFMAVSGPNYDSTNNMFCKYD